MWFSLFHDGVSIFACFCLRKKEKYTKNEKKNKQDGIQAFKSYRIPKLSVPMFCFALPCLCAL